MQYKIIKFIAPLLQKQSATSRCGQLLILLCLALPSLGSAQINEHADLPYLGDTASAQVSLQEEHKLGRAWLKALRSRTRELNDPLLYDYLEHLLYRLAEHSQLQDRRLELVIVDSPALNAFAVPGGIVGVNGGLFLYAKTKMNSPRCLPMS